MHKGYYDISRFLIEKKVKLSFERNYDFHYKFGALPREIFSLLYNSADPEKKEMLSRDILVQAIRKKNKDLIEFLYEKKFSYDSALLESASTKIILKHDSSPSFINKLSEKGTALNIAVELNNIDIVKLLLSLQGINPSLYSKGRKTPLITAFEKGNYYIAYLIFDFYGDNVLQKTWQLNEILKKFISSVMFNFSLSFANPEVDGYTVFKKLLQL